MAQRVSAAGSLRKAPRADRGASAVEYGLMVAAIAAVITVAVFAFGGFVNETFGGASNCLEQTTTPHPDCRIRTP